MNQPKHLTKQAGRALFPAGNLLFTLDLQVRFWDSRVCVVSGLTLYTSVPCGLQKHYLWEASQEEG